MGSFSLLATCQPRPENARVFALPSAVPQARVQAAKLGASLLAGTYRQESSSCPCSLAVIIYQAGRRLHYRLEDSSEQGFVTQVNADGYHGLHFRSIPEPHEKAHEWGGDLEGDTLLVQTYGNSMNYYENYVGDCDCKFLRLVNRR